MARKISFDAPADPTPATPVQPAVPRARPLLGLERALKPSAPVGAISNSLGNISERAKRIEELEQKLIDGRTVVELDPAFIDDSFVPDRMQATEEQNAAFREIIRQHGQNVPILVRPKPDAADRYEVAFGHRRLKAARDLGIKVKAVVRRLTDEELVIAQGQENSGRTDLTFIERARFAARLEERKFSRDVIMAALNVDKAALSRLISIATRVPAPLIDAIGPAPTIGRTFWQELTDLLDQEGNRARAMIFIENPEFHAKGSDERFQSVLSTLRQKPQRNTPESWIATDGTQAAKVMRSGRKLTLAFDDRVAPQFGDFVQTKLQSLYDEFKAGKSSA